jgi:hypothetical protein
MRYQIIGIVFVIGLVITLGVFLSLAVKDKKQGVSTTNKSVYWEKLNTPSGNTYRTKTPNGWLVIRYEGMAYVPDSAHAW